MDETKFMDIPSVFYQDSEAKPFTNCTFCNKSFQSQEPYMIEKSFKKNLENNIQSTVYEYAICLECGVKKMNAMSKESIQNIQNYMQENVFPGFNEKIESNSFDEKIKNCAATGRPKETLSEYTLVGQFLGDKMLLKEFPLILSSEVGEEIQELLSEHTKREFDNFMDTITGIPPELRSLFRSKRPILA